MNWIPPNIENNPAGRLYLFIQELRKMPNEPISAAWAKILEVPDEQLGSAIGVVAQLVPQIDAALQAPGRERNAEQFSVYRHEFLAATFPLTQAFNAPVKGILPSQPAVLALGGLADHLAVTAPDGVVPGQEDQSSLLDMLHATIEAVTADAELPPEVAHLILQHLADVQLALRHIKLGGPLGVKRATEALLGTVDAVRATDKIAHVATILRDVVATAGVIWTMVSAPAVQVQPTIAAWRDYSMQPTPAHVHALHPGPLLIESGPRLEEPPDADVVDADVVEDDDDDQTATGPG